MSTMRLANASTFQCSSASRKFLNWYSVAQLRRGLVSVLFSEPKIPQRCQTPSVSARRASFSALQRAENSSSRRCGWTENLDESFSALQRAENSSIGRVISKRVPPQRFSALQRAENSSMYLCGSGVDRRKRFQCSSASRKFLNKRRRLPVFTSPSFSALQRAENSSIATGASQRTRPRWFQCSSASRKFLNHAGNADCPHPDRVSVLFSEPKIPQVIWGVVYDAADPFQCSSASRKFLNRKRRQETYAQK